MEVGFMDRTTLTGLVLSKQTVRRMAMRLNINREHDSVKNQPVRTQTISATAKTRDAMKPMLASLFIPGLGQWMQRRSGTALIFFVAWLFVLSNTAWVSWTIWKTLASVSTKTRIYTYAGYLFACAIPALDAWRMRKR